MRFLQLIAILLPVSLVWGQRGQVNSPASPAVSIQLLRSYNPGGPAGNGCPNWVMTNPILSVTDNGLARVVVTRPTSESKRIVILGSSSARGLGSSNCTSTSWAAKFGVAMVGKGYTVYNVSHEGDNSTAVINRFYTDVAPLLPNFVILAVSISNDGGPTAGNVNFHEQSVHRLIKMVEGIGAIPVLMGQFPNNGYTVAQYGMLQDLYQQEEKLGVPIFDFLSSSVDPTTGHYLSQIASSDGTHPDDNGHNVFYQSIPQSYFDVAHTVRWTETPHVSQAWRWGSDTTNIPLKVTPFPSLASFTASLWAKDNGSNFSFMGRYDSQGGNCVGCQMADPMIFRTSLQANDIVLLYNGHSVRKSLEFYSRLTAIPGTYAPNQADTGTQGLLGPTWTSLGRFTTPGDPYDLPFSIQGTLAFSTYPWISFTRAVQFPANFVGAQGSVVVNPTATRTLTINQTRAGTTTQVGTAVITTAGGVTFTTTSGAALSVIPGDRWTVGNPVNDTNLAGVNLTVIGMR
jgi:lysophospholipase L1-like esterase